MRVGDLSRGAGARSAAPDPQGPAGPAGRTYATYRAMITQFGVIAGGNANGQAHQVGTNWYRVQFPSDVAGCTYTATLAAVQNGPTLEEPPARRITVQSGGGANVLVKTYNAAGDPAEAPFHLIVAC